MKRSLIERTLEKLGILRDLSHRQPVEGKTQPPLRKYPAPDQWDDFVQLDAKAWPERKEKHFSIGPTNCFNCE